MFVIYNIITLNKLTVNSNIFLLEISFEVQWKVFELNYVNCGLEVS